MDKSKLASCLCYAVVESFSQNVTSKFAILNNFFYPLYSIRRDMWPGLITLALYGLWNAVLLANLEPPGVKSGDYVMGLGFSIRRPLPPFVTFV